MTEQGSLEVDSNTAFIDQIQSVSLDIEPVLRPMANLEGDVRYGGVFAIMDEHGELLAAWDSGKCSAADINRFRGNAINKCAAMYDNDVICSGMVADLDATPPIYDGGIKLQNGWYFAFSGFPAEIDRAMCMIIAKEVGQLGIARGNAILWRSPNHALVRAIYTEMSFGVAMHLSKKAE